MIDKASLLLTVLFLMVSCNHVFKEYDKNSFPTYSWNDGQEILFKPRIEDIHVSYAITLGVRHHYAVQAPLLRVTVKITSPSGKETSEEFKLTIKDAENKNVGSCAGDICDLEAVMFENFKFEEVGEYSVTVSHNEKGYRIPGIMEVGLVIDETE